MENKQAVEREVAETLKCLDHPVKIQSDPYFYTRLMAKIEARKSGGQRRLYTFLMKPLLPALCLLIILVNVTSVVWVIKNNAAEVYARESYLTAFAQEYSLNQPYTDVFIVNQ